MNSRSRKEVTIRNARPGDAEAIKGLDTEARKNSIRAEYIDRWLQNERVLIAEFMGEIVGYGVFSHSFFHQGFVEMLMIHPEYRRTGVGQLLLESLENLSDTPKVWVTTNLSNKAMQSLLGRRGFQPSGYIDGLDLGDPEIVYSKLVHDGLGWGEDDSAHGQ